jgi:hypothetical protein
MTDQVDDFADIATKTPNTKKPAVKRAAPKTTAPTDDFSDISSNAIPQPDPSNKYGSQYVTDDNKKEGRYLMSKSGKPAEDVPFSAVSGAIADGYDLSDLDKKRYEKDSDAFTEQQKKGQPPEGYWANAWDEAKSIPAGVASLFQEPTSTGGKIAEAALGPIGTGVVAGERLLKSEASSRKALIGQASDQAKSASNIRTGGDALNIANKAAQEYRSYLSFISALLPLPGVAAMVSKLNATIDRGDLKGAFGQASVDIPLLLTGLKASGKITDPALNLAKKATDKLVAKYRPVVVNLEDKQVPLLQSEAHPDTKAGQYTEET